MKEKRPNYKKFCLTLAGWQLVGLSYGLNDLRWLARLNHCPIPKLFKQKGDTK